MTKDPSPNEIRMPNYESQVKALKWVESASGFVILTSFVMGYFLIRNYPQDIDSSLLRRAPFVPGFEFHPVQRIVDIHSPFRKIHRSFIVT